MNPTIIPIIDKVKSNAERDVAILSSVEPQITAILDRIDCHFDTNSDNSTLQLFIFPDQPLDKVGCGDILAEAFPAWIIDRHEVGGHKWATVREDINNTTFHVTLYAKD